MAEVSDFLAVLFGRTEALADRLLPNLKIQNGLKLGVTGFGNFENSNPFSFVVFSNCFVYCGYLSRWSFFSTKETTIIQNVVKYFLSLPGLGREPGIFFFLLNFFLAHLVKYFISSQ
jgi:hypothetical protein